MTKKEQGTKKTDSSWGQDKCTDGFDGYNWKTAHDDRFALKN